MNDEQRPPMMTKDQLIDLVSNIKETECCKNCIIKMMDCTDLCPAWYEEVFLSFCDKYNVTPQNLYINIQKYLIWLKNKPV